MKRVAESSTGSHRAGNGSQRVRINIQHSNDGDGKLGLLFADGDKMRSSLRRQLVLDKGSSLHSAAESSAGSHRAGNGPKEPELTLSIPMTVMESSVCFSQNNNNNIVVIIICDMFS